jgi:rfaE bifunctional protein nucleotidyltransferase chain/domain
LEKKILNLKNLKKVRLSLEKQGKKVVFTNGCFDLLHSGHVHLFREAKRLGDILIVAVNDDDSVSRIKGPKRPIFPLNERMEILEAIQFIDYLISFSQETPKKIISSLLPDVLVKGGDWNMEEVIGREEVIAAGGEVVLIPPREGQSTSQILSRVIRSFKKR